MVGKDVQRFIMTYLFKKGFGTFIKTCSSFSHQFHQLIKSKSSGHTVQSITDEKTRVLVCDFEYYSESTAFFNLPIN